MAFCLQIQSSFILGVNVEQSCASYALHNDARLRGRVRADRYPVPSSIRQSGPVRGWRCIGVKGAGPCSNSSQGS